jgi:hypothetical protein
MKARFAVVTATAAILAVSLVATTRAEAGASASAPTKNAHNTQVSQVRTDRKSTYPITEYSSSSRRAPQQSH